MTTHEQSREINAKIVKLREEGLTNDAIGQRLGMRPATVAQRYKRYKVVYGQPSEENPMDNRQWVVRLLKLKPHTVKEIAEKLDLRPQSIYYHIRALKPRLRVSKRFTVDSRGLPIVVDQFDIDS